MLISSVLAYIRAYNTSRDWTMRSHYESIAQAYPAVHVLTSWRLFMTAPGKKTTCYHVSKTVMIYCHVVILYHHVSDPCDDPPVWVEHLFPGPAFGLPQSYATVAALQHEPELERGVFCASPLASCACRATRSS